MRKLTTVSLMFLIALSAACKKEPELKEEDVSLEKKYSKWNFLQVYKENSLKKRIAYLSKGEPVDLLGTENITINTKTIEISKIKTTDDKTGYTKSGNLADKPIVFIEETKAYVRNNTGSRVYHKIPRGTLGFIISEKGQWVQIYIGNLYDINGKKKWIDKKWVNGGYTDDLNIIPDARSYEEASLILSKGSSTTKQIKKAKSMLEEMKNTSSMFAELSTEKLKELKLREEESPESDLTEKIPAGKRRLVSAKTGLIMRSGPSQEADRISLIPDGEVAEFIEETGESVTIAGATGKWTRVIWKGKKGWVFGGFLVVPEQ